MTQHLCTVCCNRIEVHRGCDCGGEHCPPLCCPGCDCGSHEDAHPERGETIQFGTRVQAEVACERIGWRRKAAMRVKVLGFDLWTIADDHGDLLTRADYDRLLLDREAERAKARDERAVKQGT